jgi:putative oxidoreductase
MKLGRLLLRATIGGVFVGHGAQKFFGWFGGPGIDAASQFFDSLNAVAASATEVGSGALMLLGFAIPIAASGITSVMLTAINRVHGKNGLWNSSGGYEFNLVLIAASIALAEVGPGSPSVDTALGMDMHGRGWAVAALSGGAAGAAAAHLYAESQPVPQAVPQPQPAPTREVVEEPAIATQAS